MKGLLYYTDNQCQERIALTVRKQLERCRKDYPLVSVSLYPISFGNNIVLPLQRSVLSMFKQILVGLERLETDVVFFVEHDVLYHPNHFEFMPPKKDIYYFNTNVWSLDSEKGMALHYDGMEKTSGLVAYRNILIEHYTKKIKKIEAEGWSRKLIGYEPGKKRSGIDNYKRESWQSAQPNIDIRHNNNLVRTRWNLSEYRCRQRIKDSWIITGEIPYWGKTEGRFEDFLRGVYDN